MSDTSAYRRVLVAVDGSTPAVHALDQAIAIARESGGRLRLMHVVDPLIFAMALGSGAQCTDDLVEALDASGRAILDDAMQRAAKEGVPVDTKLCEGLGGRLGDIVDAQARAWSADLLVIGSHGRRGWRRLAMGNGAEQMLRTVHVPVLVVRGAADRDHGVAREVPPASVVPESSTDRSCRR